MLQVLILSWEVPYLHIWSIVVTQGKMKELHVMTMTFPKNTFQSSLTWSSGNFSTALCNNSLFPNSISPFFFLQFYVPLKPPQDLAGRSSTLVIEHCVKNGVFFAWFETFFPFVARDWFCSKLHCWKTGAKLL